MHRRAVRIALLMILVAGGLFAGLFLRNIERRASDLRASDADVSSRIARISDALIDASAAQHAYIAPGQSAVPWFERMTALVRQLYDETAALNGQLRSANAHATVEGLTEGLEALVAADVRVRENLRLDQPLMAADVIFSDSRNTINTMIGRLRELREAEAQAVETAHASLARARWVTVGATAILWLLGILLLLPTSGTHVAVTPASESSVVQTDPVPSAEASRPSPTIDLTAAAALCVDLSRVTNAAALPQLIGRAAVILDAPGMILWMAAGEELFAVTAHGYPPQVLTKLGAIARGAENATAAAWREGRTMTVAGVAHGNGAIVAPLLGPEACIGVLAAEVRPGREQDSAAQAIVTMLAAQLATAVAAWPPASSGELRAEASA